LKQIGKRSATGKIRKTESLDKRMQSSQESINIEPLKREVPAFLRGATEKPAHKESVI
jgi:hypothetical protein